MRKFCLFTEAVLLLTLLTGCGKSPAQSSDNVELTVITTFDSSDGNHSNYVKAYEAYEKASHNTINDQSEASNEEWKAKIKSLFETGAQPDVLFYFTGADADSLVGNDEVVPISEIRKEYPDYAANMKDSMMPVSTANGRQYAVPVNGYWEGLYVNKKVLAACGIALPDASYTWEQFLNDCRTIKDNGYTPIACSLNEVPHYWFEFCVYNNGKVIDHDVMPTSASDEAGQHWVAGLNDIKELYDSGFFPADTNTITDSEANALLTSDQAAFMIDGSWKLGWFEETDAQIDDFTVTYVPAKGERKSTDIIGGLSMGYYITRKAWDDPQKRDACVEFVLAMTTDEVVSSFGSTSVTALKNGTNPPPDANSLVMSALAMTKGCTGIAPAAQDALNQTSRNALFADVTKIVIGELTPAQAIDHCLSLTPGAE